MKIRRLAILDFYDVWRADRARHISGVTGLIGESLGAALLLHKLRQDGFDAKLVVGTPTTGARRSPWLDCWIAAQNGSDRRIYQVEIKNWSAYSKGGHDLPVAADPESYRAYAIRKWESVFHGDHIRDEEVAKVLVKMRVPDAYAIWNHRALACFWFCLHPRGESISLFSVPVTEGFQFLEVFSMSAYLRSLSEDIEVDMPFIDDRIALIKAILE
jgi:hypothetical protein